MDLFFLYVGLAGILMIAIDKLVEYINRHL